MNPSFLLLHLIASPGATTQKSLRRHSGLATLLDEASRLPEGCPGHPPNEARRAKGRRGLCRAAAPGGRGRLVPMKWHGIGYRGGRHLSPLLSPAAPPRSVNSVAWQGLAPARRGASRALFGNCGRSGVTLYH